MTKYNWKEEFPKILEMGKQYYTLQQIADRYGCTREWIRQLYQRNGIDPRNVGVALRANESRQSREARLYAKRGDRSQDLYEEKKLKFRNKKGNATSRGIPFTVAFSEIEWPTHCPVLGILLDYAPEGRQENSVSFDRIDPTEGYISGNVVVVSWRANRLKNDGTADEHQKIANFYK